MRFINVLLTYLLTSHIHSVNKWAFTDTVDNDMLRDLIRRVVAQSRSRHVVLVTLALYSR